VFIVTLFAVTLGGLIYLATYFMSSVLCSLSFYIPVDGQEQSPFGQVSAWNLKASIASCCMILMLNLPELAMSCLVDDALYLGLEIMQQCASYLLEETV